MKKLLSISIFSLFVSDAFADDWRMRKFDLNDNNVISEAELIQSGCRLGKRFDLADKNNDGVLNRKEAKRASDYLFRKRCPKNPQPIDIRG